MGTDFETTLSTILIVLLLPIANTDGLETFLLVVIILSLAFTLICAIVAFSRELKFEREGDPTNWKMFGHSALAFVSTKMPQTMDFTEVAFFESRRLGIDFKSYAQLFPVSAQTHHREHASMEASAGNEEEGSMVPMSG